MSPPRAAFLLALAMALGSIVVAGAAAGWAAAVRAAPRSPPAVVMETTPARLAPAATAVASFECPEGATVLVLHRSGGWAKVALGDDRGWLPASVLSLVTPGRGLLPGQSAPIAYPSE